MVDQWLVKTIESLKRVWLTLGLGLSRKQSSYDLDLRLRFTRMAYARGTGALKPLLQTLVLSLKLRVLGVLQFENERHGIAYA